MGRRGFSLLEAAVSIAVVAILAGMTAPMALKALHQRRVAATRASLKLAFEAMFGARDRRVANMRADFGFDPKVSCKTLPFLVTRSWGHVPPFGRNDGALLPWGWNGPYWQGPVLNGNPVDAWGNPIDLIHDAARGTWQLHSPGPDRRKGDDDVVYPPVPASESAFQATVLVVVTREGPDLGGKLTLRYGGDKGAHMAVAPVQTLAAKASPQTFTFTAPAGTMQLEFTPTTGAFKAFVLPMDLLPGQTREVTVKL